MFLYFFLQVWHDYRTIRCRMGYHPHTRICSPTPPAPYRPLCASHPARTSSDNPPPVFSIEPSTPHPPGTSSPILCPKTGNKYPKRPPKHVCVTQAPRGRRIRTLFLRGRGKAKFSQNTSRNTGHGSDSIATLLGGGIWEGDERRRSQFLESDNSLDGPDLFNELPIL